VPTFGGEARHHRSSIVQTRKCQLARERPCYTAGSQVYRVISVARARTCSHAIGKPWFGGMRAPTLGGRSGATPARQRHLSPDSASCGWLTVPQNLRRRIGAAERNAPSTSRNSSMRPQSHSRGLASRSIFPLGSTRKRSRRVEIRGGFVFGDPPTVPRAAEWLHVEARETDPIALELRSRCRDDAFVSGSEHPSWSRRTQIAIADARSIIRVRSEFWVPESQTASAARNLSKFTMSHPAL
jgi:hypothetical protein